MDNFRDKSTGSRWQWGGAAQESGLVKPSLMSDIGAERVSPGHLDRKGLPGRWNSMCEGLEEGEAKMENWLLVKVEAIGGF